MKHMRVEKLKEAIRTPYTFPGCYQKALYLSDGERMCLKCAKENFRSIVDSTKHNSTDGWAVLGVDVYWEGPAEFCCHCNKEMESEYGDR
jgi:hypothetical protein